MMSYQLYENGMVLANSYFRYLNEGAEFIIELKKVTKLVLFAHFMYM